MCLHRLHALRRVWRRSPPVQAMVQAYLGIQVPPEPTPRPAGRPMSADDEAAAIAEFARNFAQAGGLVH